jgi:hypothetical protein
MPPHPRKDRGRGGLTGMFRRCFRPRPPPYFGSHLRTLAASRQQGPTYQGMGWSKDVESFDAQR